MPTFYAGIHVYNSQGMRLNSAQAAAAAGNRLALFLGATPMTETQTVQGFSSVSISALQGLDFTTK